MIQLKDVHKSFGPKRVLDGFTLDVPEGETTVIIGYSGTGKSVAIKHIVGLLEPDAGEVWVDGLNVPELPRREPSRAARFLARGARSTPRSAAQCRRHLRAKR